MDSFKCRPGCNREEITSKFRLTTKMQQLTANTTSLAEEHRKGEVDDAAALLGLRRCREWCLEDIFSSYIVFIKYIYMCIYMYIIYV